MIILEKVKEQLLYLGDCGGSWILAHAAWTACDHRNLPGPGALKVSSGLDEQHKRLVFELCQITCQPDYSNDDQAEMLCWLHENDRSGYVAKQVKMSKKKLVDWV